MMGKKFLLAVPVLMFLLFISAGPVLATEDARGVYPNGAEDCYAGCLPPPGTYFINYTTYQKFDSLRDDDGHKFGNVKADIGATVFRFIKGTGCKVLGADWYWHVLIPVKYVHLTSDVELPQGRFHGSKTGLGNLTFNPMILGWHFGDWHFAAGVDINTPAPGYDKMDYANSGEGYWNVEPIFAFTYLNKSGFEVGAKFMYDYNFTNWQTDYQTGQEFHVDWAIGQKVNNFKLAIVGFYYQQMTKDETGSRGPDLFYPAYGLNAKGTDIAPFKGKARVWALGPMVRYDYKNMFFLAKWYHEFDAENTVEGDGFWFKFFYAF
jgi:hypothetical protein